MGEPHELYNEQHARLDCGRSLVQTPVGQTKDCFYAKHAALRSKSKDGLNLNQDNEWSNMSTFVPADYADPVKRC